MLVSQFDRVKLLLETADVLFLGHFHLLQDLLLSVELSVEVLCPGNRLVDLVLELKVLLLQDLNLPVGRVQLNLSVLQGQDLIFEFTARLEKARVGLCVTLLLIFVPLDPKFSCLLLVRDNLVKTLDSVIKLGLRELKGLLDAHFLSLYGHHGVFELIDLLVSFF